MCVCAGRERSQLSQSVITRLADGVAHETAEPIGAWPASEPPLMGLGECNQQGTLAPPLGPGRRRAVRPLPNYVCVLRKKGPEIRPHQDPAGGLRDTRQQRRRRPAQRHSSQMSGSRHGDGLAWYSVIVPDGDTAGGETPLPGRAPVDMIEAGLRRVLRRRRRNHGRRSIVPPSSPSHPDRLVSLQSVPWSSVT